MGQLPKFAVVDVETSGLSTRRGRILQIGLITIDPDGTVLDEWSTLVRLRRPQVSGI
jgi:DNA polymerase-3 subunit epsilon